MHLRYSANIRRDHGTRPAGPDSTSSDSLKRARRPGRAVAVTLSAARASAGGGGVIRGYRALIDPAVVGRGLRVFAGVRLVRHTRADVVAFERGVTRLPAVAACHHITGTT